MNGLEVLKRIRQETAPNTYCKDFDKEECCNTIEKELKDGEKYKKTLEIIKKDPQRALLIPNYKDYNEYINDKNPYWVEKELMEKDEFDLLKEVLG